MSKKTIKGSILCVVVGVAGIYFVGINNVVASLFVALLAISVAVTCKNIEADKLRICAQ